MKQIIAMGGGGFSMEPENLLLDQYVLNQTEKSNPKTCFVPTASGESQEYILNFYRALSILPVDQRTCPYSGPQHLTWKASYWKRMCSSENFIRLSRRVPMF